MNCIANFQFVKLTAHQKIKYLPPTGGTSKQEAEKVILLFLCPESGRKGDALLPCPHCCPAQLPGEYGKPFTENNCQKKHPGKSTKHQQPAADKHPTLASHPLIPDSVNRFDISIAISLNLASYPADGGGQGVFVHIVFIRIPQPFQKALPGQDLFGIFAEQVQHLILHRGKGKGFTIPRGGLFRKQKFLQSGLLQPWKYQSPGSATDYTAPRYFYPISVN